MIMPGGTSMGEYLLFSNIGEQLTEKAGDKI